MLWAQQHVQQRQRVLRPGHVPYKIISDGNKAIRAPKRAQIESLPEGYTSLKVDDKVYGYYQGDFYVQGADGK